MSLGFTTGLSGQQEARMDVQVKLLASAAIAMERSEIARIDCARQMRLVQALVTSGAIAVVHESEVGEYDADARAEERKCDSEAEYSDDDEPHDEVDPPAELAAPGAGDATPLDPLLRYYEIRIVKGARGWTCIPPRNPLLGYHACVNWAHKVVDVMSAQFAFYDAVAKWLRDEGDAVLESPSALGGGHRRKTKKEFSGEIGVDDTIIGYYCRNCRLSWRDASLPLDSLFR